MALVGNPTFSIGETTSVQSPNLSIGETASDLDSCGKRKRGNEIQEINAAMAKTKAKESRMVSEFTDFSDLLRRFKNKMIFEDEDFDLMRDYCDSDEDYDMKEEMKRSLPFDKGPVVEYINQVRNSGGFDVDVKLPRWLDVGWDFINLPVAESRDEVYERAKLAIDEINVDMKSKAFELVEVVKAVMSKLIFQLSFLTLAVKEVGAAATNTLTVQAIVYHPFNAPWKLREWRFKPEVV
ncbi:uncharacterized protein LOC125223567 isoform X2 [Salvia hispanica]|uniref:uncharacterized protein LOC125223567 isoform X2 n=1 Tax=Salvia hispanica TaxID=49212 RepID=UPI002009C6D4|nr:uncharacterized protein LOC125223567 isoform X2 [Salvia hispanica]